MAYYANSSEGEQLDIQCGRCPLGQMHCPTALIQSIYNYDQLYAGQEKLREAMDTLVDNKNGCQTYQLLKKAKLTQ